MDGFVSDDEITIPFFTELGINIEIHSWRANLDWNLFDMVILRTTWDYQNYASEFLNVLDKIHSSRANLQNHLELIKWNFDKSYLRELEKKGNTIVPTIWGDQLNRTDIKLFYEQLNCGELVIKPTVSANADNTFRLTYHKFEEKLESLQQIFDGRSYLVQPFMQRIISQGEFSLFFFNGDYSHTILKTPKDFDFRVQEEHGGIITSAEPDSQMMSDAFNVIKTIPYSSLYARVDFVKDDSNVNYIMEVELIEPALYFRMDKNSPRKFVEAVLQKLN